MMQTRYDHEGEEPLPASMAITRVMCPFKANRGKQTSRESVAYQDSTPSIIFGEEKRNILTKLESLKGKTNAKSTERRRNKT
jgi:hypothetical protein